MRQIKVSTIYINDSIISDVIKTRLEIYDDGSYAPEIYDHFNDEGRITSVKNKRVEHYTVDDFGIVVEDGEVLRFIHKTEIIGRIKDLSEKGCQLCGNRNLEMITKNNEGNYVNQIVVSCSCGCSSTVSIFQE